MNILNKVRLLLDDLLDTKIPKQTKIEYINNSIWEYSRNISNYTFSNLEYDNNLNCYHLPDDFADLITLKTGWVDILWIVESWELREYADFVINKKDKKIFIISWVSYWTLYIQYNKIFNQIFQTSITTEANIWDNKIIVNAIWNIKIWMSIIVWNNETEEELIVSNIVDKDVFFTTTLTKVKAIWDIVIWDLDINSWDENLIILYFNYLYKTYFNIINDWNEENWSQWQISQTIKYNQSSSWKNYLNLFQETIKQNAFYKFQERWNWQAIWNIRINLV